MINKLCGKTMGESLIFTTNIVLIFPPRGNKIYVVSLKKANKREVKKYEEKN